MCIEPEILNVFDNGVIEGNVPGHKQRYKRELGGQLWFPEDWDEEKINIAGTAVANTRKGVECEIIDRFDGVNVKILFNEDGNVETICPYYEQ